VPDLVGMVGVTTSQNQCPYYTASGTRTRFKDDDEITQASESYLESMQQELYLTGNKALFDKCNICIAVKGDYVEQ